MDLTVSREPADMTIRMATLEPIALIRAILRASPLFLAHASMLDSTDGRKRSILLPVWGGDH